MNNDCCINIITRTIENIGETDQSNFLRKREREEKLEEEIEGEEKGRGGGGKADEERS